MAKARAEAKLERRRRSRLTKKAAGLSAEDLERIAVLKRTGCGQGLPAATVNHVLQSMPAAGGASSSSSSGLSTAASPAAETTTATAAGSGADDDMHDDDDPHESAEHDEPEPTE